MSVEDELRQAIKESGLSAYEIARRAEALGEKLDHKAISRYQNQQKGINSSTFSLIAEVLGLGLAKRGEAPPCRQPPDFQEEALRIGIDAVNEVFEEIKNTRLDVIEHRLRLKLGRTAGSDNLRSG